MNHMKFSQEKPCPIEPTGVPFKKLMSGYDGVEGKFKSILELIKGEFDNISPNNRPTVLDFHGISPDLKEEDILLWIKKEIGIEPDLIDTDGKTADSATAYQALNYSYQKGIDFLKNKLKYSEKEVSIGPPSISCKKDLFLLLNKTKFMQEENGLSRALLYCRLVKATIIAFETLKSDANLLKQNTVDFEKALISPVLMEDSINTPLKLLSKDGGEKRFYATQDGSLKGTLKSRGKDFEKVMLRFINRADSSAELALKDGIASRIKIEVSQGKKLLPILCKWLKEDMGVATLEIENHSFFGEDELTEINESITNILSFDKFKLTNLEGKSNSTSVGSFKALKITGKLKGKNNEHARQFEIQLVEPNNKNEKGKMNHSVYDVLKLVTARTRLDGGCPENIFLEFAKEAGYKSGFSEEKIKHYLIEAEDAPVLKVSKRNCKPIYVARSVYSRWNSFNWADPSLMSDIEFSGKKKRF